MTIAHFRPLAHLHARCPLARALGLAAAATAAALVAMPLAGCILVVTDHDNEDLAEYHHLHTSHGQRLGVSLAEPSPALAAQTGIDRSQAAVITGVREGWPADKAGLQKYDIVTQVDGHAASASELVRAVHAKASGEPLRLTLVRAGRTMDVTVPTPTATPASN